MISVIISSVLQLNTDYKVITGYKGNTKFVFEIKELKELKKRKYLCPENIKYISSHKNVGSALSGILLKPYYTNISIIDRRANWGNAALRWAVPSKVQVSNPCTNE